MKRPALLPWTLLLIYATTHWLWASGLLLSFKYHLGYETKNDALILESLDQDEKGKDFTVLLSLGQERLSLASRQCQHVLEQADQMVAEHPKDPNPLILRARAWKSTGRMHAAVDDMRAAKRLIESGGSQTRYADTPGLERVDELLKQYEGCLKEPK